MSKKCGNCGAPAPDDNAVFCNRCGAGILATVLTCRKCGKTFSDEQSRFCDQCGSLLAPAVQAASPVIPAAQGKNCPACGFENFGENRFYCKKCGVYIPKTEPVRKNESAGKTDISRPKEDAIRIKPVDTDALRKIKVHEPVKKELHPMQQVAVPEELVKKPVRPLSEHKAVTQQRGWGSYRRVAFGAAGVIVLVVVIAIIAVSVPSILNAGAANSTAPGLPDWIPWVHSQNDTTISNKPVPVFNDTPLTPKVT